MLNVTPLEVVQAFLASDSVDELANTVHRDVVVEEWIAPEHPVVGLDRLIAEILAPAQSAFSDPEYEMISFVASDDLVAVHARFHGIFSGPYLGCQPTMKRVDWSFHDKFQVVDGKIVAMWFCSDTYAIIRQIGVPGTA
ncbi:ester cyclase [Nostoc sp. CHAB 5844]|nr:ester cyclase [Nostoc sp. CHAB 5844]